MYTNIFEVKIEVGDKEVGVKDVNFPTQRGMIKLIELEKKEVSFAGGDPNVWGDGPEGSNIERGSDVC